MRHDILAIGNAIVDVIAAHDDAFLAGLGIPKGSMRLISAQEAEELYAHMGPAREVSGGSAANTTAGVAALGGRAAFVGRVSDDQLGRVFAHDIRAAGVAYELAPASPDTPTGQCLIVVTPDAQRTMSTYLGSCQELDETDIADDAVAGAAITYCEAYLFDPPAPTRALLRAMELAHAHGREVAFSLSDVFCVRRRGAEMRALLARGAVDVLIGNEHEAMELVGAADVGTALEALAAMVPVAVITRSKEGALAASGSERVEVPVSPAARVVDTTGAGDLFAAGFLLGRARGRSLAQCAAMGTIAAAEVIEHYGARPEDDLARRVEERLGFRP